MRERGHERTSGQSQPQPIPMDPRSIMSPSEPVLPKQRESISTRWAPTAKGTALLQGSGVGPSPNPTIAVKISLSGLRPGSVHAVQILLGVCGAAAPTTGLLFSVIFNPATFTLNNLTRSEEHT